MMQTKSLLFFFESNPDPWARSQSLYWSLPTCWCPLRGVSDGLIEEVTAVLKCSDYMTCNVKMIFSDELEKMWRREVDVHRILTSILILPFHLFLGLQSGLLASGFPTKTLCAYVLSATHATCSSHLILLGLVTRNIWWVHVRLPIVLFSPALCYFVQLTTLSSNVLSVCSCLNGGKCLTST